MPPREWRLRVEDILECIAKIERYTAGMTLESFEADEMKVDAVMRNFTVIGEAARHVPAEIEARHPDVPWAEMRGMRNVIVHEYSSVNVSVVWQTLQQRLPPLAPRLRRVLEEG